MDLNERCAKSFYEGAKLHADQLGCPVLPRRWEEHDEDFRRGFLKQISDLCAGKEDFRDFRETHDDWMKRCLEAGWVRGQKYDPTNKTHPDLVPFDELDPKEKVKDEVFICVLAIARNCIW